MEIVISVDVLDGKKGKIINLPKGLVGRDFSNDELRKAFKNEAIEVAKRFKPAYLMLALEINGYYETYPKDFYNYISLYGETCDSVKRVSPNTTVAVTFQYDVLKAKKQWGLIDLFGEKLDAICFTTYPDLVYGSLNKIPHDYYLKIPSKASDN